MFERFTEHARRAIFFARKEASDHGSATIETEHFLLGMLPDGKNLFRRFFSDDIEILRQKMETRVSKKERSSNTSIDIPLSTQCKRILQYARDESESLRHHHVGTEHLLIGILMDKDCIGAHILGELGLDLDHARSEFGKALPPRTFEDEVRERLSLIESTLSDILFKLET